MARIFLQTGDSSITISGPSTILPLSSKTTGNFKIILGTSTATADLSRIGKAAASTVVEIHRPSTDYHEVVHKGYAYILAGTSTDLKTAVVKLPIAKKADSTAVKLKFSDYKTDVAITKEGNLEHAPDGTTPVTLAASATSIDEGQTVTYTATLASPAPVGGVKIPYTLSGISADDFGLTSLTGTIAIAAGKTTGTLVLNAAADNTTEGLETLAIALQAAPRVELGAITTASTTIVDTSKTPVTIPTVALSASATTVDENAPNNVVTYTATLSSPAISDLSIPYTLGGTAVAADYSTTSIGTINIATGATTGTLVLNTVADATTEGAETVSVTLGTATGVTLGSVVTQSTALVDTSITKVTLDTSTATVNEGSLVTYTATLSSPATSDLSIPYTLGGGTAVAADYSTTSTGTINIATGATTGTLVLNTVADATTEGAETVSVTLGTATGVTLGSVATQSTTITDTSVTNPFTTIQLANSPVTATTAAEAFVFDFQMVGGRPTKAATSGEVTITGFDVTKDKLVFNDVGTGTVYTEAQFMALPGVVLAQNPFDATNTTIYVDPLGSVLGGVTIVGIQDKALASIVLETTA